MILVNIELKFIFNEELCGCKYILLLIFNYVVVDIDVLFVCGLVLEKVRVNCWKFVYILILLLIEKVIIDIWNR